MRQEGGRGLLFCAFTSPPCQGTARPRTHRKRVYGCVVPRDGVLWVHSRQPSTFGRAGVSKDSEAHDMLAEGAGPACLCACMPCLRRREGGTFFFYEIRDCQRHQQRRLDVRDSLVLAKDFLEAAGGAARATTPLAPSAGEATHIKKENGRTCHACFI